MNKRGFTLVEVIVVISLLGLVVIISSTSILSGSTRAKEKMLETKIKNIEKAAVLYGQDNRHLISYKVYNGYNNSEIIDFSLCFKDEDIDESIPNCYYYYDNKNKDNKIEREETLITVGFLAENNYIDYDDKKTKIIKNPVDDTLNINDCEIQIYQKYGKIYAAYKKEITIGQYTQEEKDKYKANCWK